MENPNPLDTPQRRGPPPDFAARWTYQRLLSLSPRTLQRLLEILRRAPAGQGGRELVLLRITLCRIANGPALDDQSGSPDWPSAPPSPMAGA